MSSRAITKNDLYEIFSRLYPGAYGSAHIIGEIITYGGTAIPDGWLECDGRELLISEYSDLYSVIGDTWGVPSDNDHFVIPDFSGRVAVGASSEEWINVARENANATITITSPTAARFGTGTSWAYATMPPGTYTVTWAGLQSIFITDPASGTAKMLQVKLQTGSNGGSDTHTLSTDELASHSHTTPNHNHSTNLYQVTNRFGSGSRDAAGTYSGYGNLQYTSNASPTTNASGGTKPFSIMQPFAVVRYLICYMGLSPTGEFNIDSITNSDIDDIVD